jgi:hypothetical protein
VYRVHRSVYSVGFEPPWFSLLGRMDPRNSLEDEFFSSDNLFSMTHNACLTLNRLVDIQQSWGHWDLNPPNGGFIS